MLAKAIVLTGVLLWVPCFLAFAPESKQDQDVKNPDGEVIPREFKGYTLGTDYREYPNLSYYDPAGDTPGIRLCMFFRDSKDEKIRVHAYNKEKDNIYGLVFRISWTTADVDIDTFNGVVQTAKDKYKYIECSREVYADGNTMNAMRDDITRVVMTYHLSDKKMSIVIMDVSMFAEYARWVWYYNNNPEEFAKWKARSLLPK